MENLIGFLIFVTIAIVSSVMQNAKQKREDAERKAKQELKKQQRGTAPNMPEATRRMLYGDGDREIPTAQPRQTPHPTAVPRPAIPAAPRAQDMAPRAPERMAPQTEHTQRPAVPRPPAAPQRVPQPTQRTARPRALVQPQEVRRQSRQTMQQTTRQQQGTYQEPTTREAAQTQPAPRRQAPAPAHHTLSAAERIQSMLRQPASLRDAVILSELLGPPIALREQGSRF
jgi:hypothetical protein